MCTVFVADAAAEAHNEGFEVRDLFAGFQYSVIHNYINRVMGQRTFGQRDLLPGQAGVGNVARLDAGCGHRSRSGGAAQSRRDGRMGHRPVRDRRTRSGGARGGAPLRTRARAGRRGRGQERVPVPRQPLRHALHDRAHARRRARRRADRALGRRVPQVRGGVRRAREAPEGSAVGVRRAAGVAGPVSRGAPGRCA